MNEELLRRIALLIFDVDGVLSSQTIPLGYDGVPVRTANIHDGYAMQLAIKRGLPVAIISGAKTETLRVRYQGLGLQDIHLGVAIKMDCYERLLSKYGLTDAQVLYMGDDIPDYQVMARCALPVCPLDAAPEIRALARYVSPCKGGEGCVRDVIEQVLKAKGKWMGDNVAFGW